MLRLASRWNFLFVMRLTISPVITLSLIAQLLCPFSFREIFDFFSYLQQKVLIYITFTYRSYFNHFVLNENQIIQSLKYVHAIFSSIKLQPLRMQNALYRKQFAAKAQEFCVLIGNTILVTQVVRKRFTHQWK